MRAKDEDTNVAFILDCPQYLKKITLGQLKTPVELRRFDSSLC
jgi:hypothetical protein